MVEGVARVSTSVTSHVIILKKDRITLYGTGKGIYSKTDKVVHDNHIYNRSSTYSASKAL